MACAPPSPMHAATTFGRAIQPLGRARTTGRQWKWCFLIFDLGRSLQLVGLLETPVWLMVLDSFMFKWFSVVGLGGIQIGHANWGLFFGIAFFATTLKVDSTSGKNRCLGKLVFLKTGVQSHPQIMVLNINPLKKGLPFEERTNQYSRFSSFFHRTLWTCSLVLTFYTHALYEWPHFVIASIFLKKTPACANPTIVSPPSQDNPNPFKIKVLKWRY